MNVAFLSLTKSPIWLHAHTLMKVKPASSYGSHEIPVLKHTLLCSFHQQHCITLVKTGQGLRILSTVGVEWVQWQKQSETMASNSWLPIGEVFYFLLEDIQWINCSDSKGTLFPRCWRLDPCLAYNLKDNGPSLACSLKRTLLCMSIAWLSYIAHVHKKKPPLWNRLGIIASTSLPNTGWCCSRVLTVCHEAAGSFTLRSEWLWWRVKFFEGVTSHCYTWLTLLLVSITFTRI